MPEEKCYIGSKIIRAHLMDEITYLKEIKKEDIDDNRETRQGYLVKYPDGYKSWSPKKVFENAYRPILQSEKELID